MAAWLSLCEIRGVEEAGNVVVGEVGYVVGGVSRCGAGRVDDARAGRTCGRDGQWR